jgi:hypothetical protein
MKKPFKIILSTLTIGVFIFFATASGEDAASGEETTDKKPEINIGSTYSIDAYHQIQFKSNTRYWIYQKPLNCGGEGNWSISGDKVILEQNDSNCESTRKIKGEYSIEDIVN